MSVETALCSSQETLPSGNNLRLLAWVRGKLSQSSWDENNLHAILLYHFGGDYPVGARENEFHVLVEKYLQHLNEKQKEKLLPKILHASRDPATELWAAQQLLAFAAQKKTVCDSLSIYAAVKEKVMTHSCCAEINNLVYRKMGEFLERASHKELLQYVYDSMQYPFDKTDKQRAEATIRNDLLAVNVLDKFRSSNSASEKRAWLRLIQQCMHMIDISSWKKELLGFCIEQQEGSKNLPTRDEKKSVVPLKRLPEPETQSWSELLAATPEITYH